MPPPSPLTIATQAVNRLVKEESYYRKELGQQAERVKKLEAEAPTSGDSNAEFMVRQERKALEETNTVLPPLREKIAEAVRRLEEQLATVEGGGEGEGGGAAAADEVAKAKAALELGRAVGVDAGENAAAAV